MINIGRTFGMVLTLFSLAACESVIAPNSQLDSLKTYKSYNQRIDNLLAPLLSANRHICPRIRGESGVRLHQLSDYPKTLQMLAKTEFLAQEKETVFYVLEGSPADKAGVKAGDTLTQAKLNALGKDNKVCGYGFKIRYEETANAFATGTDILITSGLIRSLDDASLQLVLAHELAHNILGHAGKELKPDVEHDADHLAVFLMARAGLDYHQISHLPAAISRPHRGRFYTDKTSKARKASFIATITEIDALKEAGKPLNPTKP